MSVVKSLRSANVISYVSFINNTPGSVSIYWHNFEGELVKYDDIKPGESYSAKTFTEHPWSAKDTATGYKVLTDNRYVFYPRPNPSVHERISIERPPGKNLHYYLI